jgi:ribonuclease HI
MACIINLFNVIWFRRNQIRFQGKIINWRTTINLVISKVSLSGNLTSKTSASNIQEFTIMKFFKVNIKPPKATGIKEVIWFPPFHSWIKVNTDGASVQNPLRVAAGGIFRNSDGDCLGGFAQFLGPVSALIAELSDAMATIELAAANGFRNVWLESDSQLVILAFKSNSVVPWSLRNKWENCLHLTHTMAFCATHIYREGNVCADILAN